VPEGVKDDEGDPCCRGGRREDTPAQVRDGADDNRGDRFRGVEKLAALFLRLGEPDACDREDQQQDDQTKKEKSDCQMWVARSPSWAVLPR